MAARDDDIAATVGRVSLIQGDAETTVPGQEAVCREHTDKGSLDSYLQLVSFVTGDIERVGGLYH